MISFAVVTELRPVLARAESDRTAGPVRRRSPPLDSTSATLLGHLVDADLVFLVATVRTTRRRRWPRGAVAARPCVRVDLDELDQTPWTRCCTSSPRSDRSEHHSPRCGRSSKATCCCSESSSSPCRRCRSPRHTTAASGDCSGPSSPPRLHELFRPVSRRWYRPDRCPRPARPLRTDRVGIARSDRGPEPLEMLDRAGLADRPRSIGQRQQVTLAHPLYGEIAPGRMPVTDARRLLLEHADRIESNGPDGQARTPSVGHGATRRRRDPPIPPPGPGRPTRSLRAGLSPGRAAETSGVRRGMDPRDRLVARRSAPRAPVVHEAERSSRRPNDGNDTSSPSVSPRCAAAT